MFARRGDDAATMQDLRYRSFPLCLAAALSLGASSAAQEPPTGGEDPLWLEALKSGKHWVQLRLRAENVEQEGFDDDATALTLRTVLGYESATWQGFSGLIEGESVTPFGGEAYNSTTNETFDRPVVADPDEIEANQAYLQYTGLEDTVVRAGRQRIILNNHRFVGNVGWRQNEQTFDAHSLVNTSVEDLTLVAAYVYNVNRVFGDDNPTGNIATDTIALNAAYLFPEVGTLTAYYLSLDNETDPFLALSTWTVGASWDGKSTLQDFDLSYRAEYATQEDTGDNPNDVDADYWNLELGVGVREVVVKLGMEMLGGTGDPGDRFTTPLATLHKFNGWADVFLNTPDDGLEDAYLSLETSASDVALAAIYHQFSADNGGDEYGSELDLQVTTKLSWGAEVGLKYADFSADDDPFQDVTKTWAWIGMSF